MRKFNNEGFKKFLTENNLTETSQILKENLNEAIRAEDINGFEDFPEHIQNILSKFEIGNRNDSHISNIEILQGRLHIAYDWHVYVFDKEKLKKASKEKYLQKIIFTKKDGVEFVFLSQYGDNYST